MKELQMTHDEVIAWIEAGLQCDGVDLGDWEQDAILRYGRLLHQQLLNKLCHMLTDALWVADMAVNCVADETAANTFAEQISKIRKMLLNEIK